MRPTGTATSAATSGATASDAQKDHPARVTRSAEAYAPTPMNEICAMLSWPVLISNRRLRVSTRFISSVVATSREYESRVRTGTAAPAPARRPKPSAGDSPGLRDTEQAPASHVQVHECEQGAE